MIWSFTENILSKKGGFAGTQASTFALAGKWIPAHGGVTIPNTLWPECARMAQTKPPGLVGPGGSCRAWLSLLTCGCP